MRPGAEIRLAPAAERVQRSRLTIALHKPLSFLSQVSRRAAALTPLPYLYFRKAYALI